MWWFVSSPFHIYIIRLKVLRFLFFIHFESILRVVMGWDFQYPKNMSVFTFFDLPTSILAPQSMALFEAKLQKVSWSNLLLLLELDTRSSLNDLEIRFWKLFPPWNNWLILTAAIAKGQVFLGFFCSGCFLDTFCIFTSFHKIWNSNAILCVLDI